MTTQLAAKAYLAEHMSQWSDKGWAVYNPNGEDPDDLPTIYGFNNGGSRDFLSAVLLAEDGTGLGGHACSAEGYMPHDLGVIEGSRPDRHETFREHYPNGYKMEFVGYADAFEHEGLSEAIKRAQAKQEVT